MSAVYKQAVDVLINSYRVMYSSPYKIEPCFECKDEILLVWDNTIKPYFTHTHNPTCTSTSAIMGELRVHAGKCLVDFLSTFGNTLVFTTKCKCCYRTLIEKYENIAFVSLNYVYVYQGKRFFLDVACFDITSNLIFAVMFRNSVNCTSDAMATLNVPWVSVSVLDLITKSAFAASSSIYQLRNYCMTERCYDPACLTLRELAYSLGYLITHRAYSCPSRKFLDIAATGRFSPDIDMWYSAGWTTLAGIPAEGIIKLWNSFLRRNCCLRCGIKAHVEYKKPYCLGCFIKSGSDKVPLVRTNAGIEAKRDLNAAFMWLNGVPSVSLEERCFFCNRTYTLPEDNISHSEFWEPDTNRVEATTWWHGEKKRCCTLCLVDKTLEYGIEYEVTSLSLDLGVDPFSTDKENTSREARK